MLHVGIIVTKFDAEMKFYQEVLGFREIWRGSKSPEELSWVNLQVPDGEDYIELMLYKDTPASDKRGTAHHIALEVPDMDASPRHWRHCRIASSTRGRSRRRPGSIASASRTCSIQMARARS